MIAATMTVRDEADIVGACLSHLFLEGVDVVFVAHGPSEDDTLDVLMDYGSDLVRIYDDPDPIHHQPAWMDRLAADAAEWGADWILPVDADEFWVAVDGNTVSDALYLQTPDIRKTSATMWHHWNWNTRNVQPKPLTKVAYRWDPNARMDNGNHDVSVGPSNSGVLEVREIQYRGFEHFVSKIVARNASVDPARPGAGHHHKRLAGLSRDELWAEWLAMHASTIEDPIPSRMFPVPQRLIEC